MIPHVVEVQPLPQNELWLRFDTGRYKLLKDRSLWSQVTVAYGTVEWPNGLDFDPEDLYALSVAE
jgi:hypothetical protein